MDKQAYEASVNRILEKRAEYLPYVTYEGAPNDAFGIRLNNALKSINRENISDNRTRYDMLRALEQDVKDEALSSTGEKILMRLPSYLGFGAAGATGGYLLAPDDWKTTGAVTGGLLGLLVNYVRRKSYYGSLVDV